VRLERTGVLNGFIIFLIATDAPVSWSFAELKRAYVGDKEDWGEETYHTSPNAPGEGEQDVAYGWRGMTHPCQRVGDLHILWLPEDG
jgi:hypothetical protein